MEKSISKEPKKVSSGLTKIYKSTAGAVFIVTILITLAVHLATSNFYSVYNISTLIRQVSFTILVAFGQTLVLLLGGIDLSLASIAGFCSMTAAELMTKTAVNPIICVFIALAVGLILGSINGLFICGLKITPFIVTLATGSIFKGIVYVITRGKPIIGIPSEITPLGQGTLFGFLPYPTLIMLIICAVLVITLRYAPFGRHIYAVGGNENAAKIVGIRVDKVKMWVYSLAGLLSACAGILMVLRLGASQVNIGENWVMPSITAAILGGTAMSGGIGGMVGTIVGGLLWVLYPSVSL
jgi:ribose transport system permease protein